MNLTTNKHQKLLQKSDISMNYNEDNVNPELGLLLDLTKELFGRLQANRDTLSKLQKQSEVVSTKEGLKRKDLQQSTERHEETFQSLGIDFNGNPLRESLSGDSDDNDSLSSRGGGDNGNYNQSFSSKEQGLSAKSVSVLKNIEKVESWRKNVASKHGVDELPERDQDDDSHAQPENIVDSYKENSKDAGKEKKKEGKSNNEESYNDDSLSPLLLDQKESVDDIEHSRAFNEAELSSENLSLRVELQRLEVIEQKITDILGKYDMATQSVCDGARAYLREYSHASQSLIYSYEARLHEEKVLQGRLLTTRDGMLTELNNIKSLTTQANSKMLRNLMEKTDKLNNTTIKSIDELNPSDTSKNNQSETNDTLLGAEVGLYEKTLVEGVPSLVKYESQIKLP